jgi:hypothetical protein
MDTKTQQQYAETFHNLHRKGEPLILFNAWDVAAVSTCLARRFLSQASLPKSLRSGLLRRYRPSIAAWTQRLTMGSRSRKPLLRASYQQMTHARASPHL